MNEQRNANSPAAILDGEHAIAIMFVFAVASGLITGVGLTLLNPSNWVSAVTIGSGVSSFGLGVLCLIILLINARK